MKFNTILKHKKINKNLIIIFLKYVDKIILYAYNEYMNNYSNEKVYG